MGLVESHRRRRKEERRRYINYKTLKLNNNKGGGDLEMGRPTGSERQSWAPAQTLLISGPAQWSLPNQNDPYIIKFFSFFYYILEDAWQCGSDCFSNNFFMLKCMPLIFFYFLKIIFDISTSKWFKTYKPY